MQKQINVDWKQLKLKVVEFVRSVRGRNFVTFTVFLLISTFFWFLMALNDELQRDFVLPVKFENVPSDITLLNSEPLKLNVSLKDKGSSLIRYSWGNAPEVKFDFKEINVPQMNRVMINPLRVNNAIRSIFGQASIVTLRPDSVMIPYTKLSGKKVNIAIVEGEIQVSPQYVISGPIVVENDTVKLYSQTRIKNSLNTIETEPVNTEQALTDTFRVEVPLVVPDGMRAIPSKVTVMIPVEPLISKEIAADVQIVNAPKNKSVLLFPSRVSANVLIPLSVYNSSKEDVAVTVVADYSKRNSKTSKIPLKTTTPTGKFRRIDLSADSVEFLIEQN